MALSYGLHLFHGTRNHVGYACDRSQIVLNANNNHEGNGGLRTISKTIFEDKFEDYFEENYFENYLKNIIDGGAGTQQEQDWTVMDQSLR